MTTFDPMTLALAGIIAIALVAAALAFEAGRAYTDRKTAGLRADLADASSRYNHLAREMGKLVARMEQYADACDADSDDLAEYAERVRRLEAASRPSPREQMAKRMPGTVLALPAAPSVRDAIQPTWNGGTATFDSLATALGISATDTGTWLPSGPDVGRVQLAMPLRSDDTSRIPKIDVTGELVEVTPHG